MRMKRTSGALMTSLGPPPFVSVYCGSLPDHANAVFPRVHRCRNPSTDGTTEAYSANPYYERDY